MTQSHLLFVVPRSIYTVRQQSSMQDRLRQFGCDIQFINDGETLYQLTQSLGEEQEEAQRKSKAATQTLSETRTYLHHRYMQHLSLARVALKDNQEAADKLDFKGERAHRLDTWLKQTNKFYRNALGYSETLGLYNIPRYELEESQTLLGQMIELSALQKQAQSQAQMLTQKKQLAFADLEQWYRKLLKVAAFALEEEPQQLEALGVVI